VKGEPTEFANGSDVNSRRCLSLRSVKVLVIETVHSCLTAAVTKNHKLSVLKQQKLIVLQSGEVTNG
jgi:hypothetical protein